MEDINVETEEDRITMTRIYSTRSSMGCNTKKLASEITPLGIEASVKAKLKTEEENDFQKDLLVKPPFYKAPSEKLQSDDCRTLNTLIIKTEPEEVSLSVKSGGNQHIIKVSEDVGPVPYCSPLCKEAHYGCESENCGLHCECVPGYAGLKTEPDQQKIKCEPINGKQRTAQTQEKPPLCKTEPDQQKIKCESIKEKQDSVPTLEDLSWQPPLCKTEPDMTEIVSPFCGTQQAHIQGWCGLPGICKQMPELRGVDTSYPSQAPGQSSSANGNTCSSEEQTPVKKSHREVRQGKCPSAPSLHSNHGGPKSYSCSECGRTFSTSSSLHRHIRIHTRERLFQCSQCDKTFTQSKSFKLHQRTHTGEKPYKCTHCGKTFTRIDVLQIHQRIHTGEKPYLCPQCGKSFTRLDVYRNHHRTHTGEKPYQCSQCAKMFTRLDVYQIHQRIHTGEKPYLCSSCGKRFLNLSNLRNHQRTHTEERPYHCACCDKTFIQSGHLTKHKKTHNV